jgi:hypothetical protein
MRIDVPLPFHGYVVWLTADQGGRSSEPPPTPLDTDYAATGYVPPATAASGLASNVLRVSKRTAWRSAADARWLVGDNLPPHRVGVGGWHGPGRALRGDSRIQRGRPAPAHRHFGSATSRTRTTDATPTHQNPKDHDIPELMNPPLDIEGSQMSASVFSLQEEVQADCRYVEFDEVEN